MIRILIIHLPHSRCENITDMPMSLYWEKLHQDRKTKIYEYYSMYAGYCSQRSARIEQLFRPLF